MIAATTLTAAATTICLNLAGSLMRTRLTLLIFTLALTGSLVAPLIERLLLDLSQDLASLPAVVMLIRLMT
jgi:hypothetical protein